MHIGIILPHLSGSLFVVLMASLISVAITHAVIRLLTRTHANGLCSHLLCSLPEPVDAPLSIVSLTSAAQMIWYHTERENWRKCFFCGPHRVLSCVLLIDSKNPWNPLQMCYCSGSGAYNRSVICFSFFHFSVTLRYLSASSCNSSFCSELLTAVSSLLRPRLQLFIVHQMQQRYFSYCGNLCTKWKHNWLYQI